LQVEVFEILTKANNEFDNSTSLPLQFPSFDWPVEIESQQKVVKNTSKFNQKL